MGGCRCTYRNCTVRSDGKTHMFHYPVFEKVRCHQWLVNAHRLEFLDLKVSQLKNRVVCQHHFKDECFMNYKKEKLTFDAVPTEDGPYCDSSKWIKQNTNKEYSIILEDIENDCITFSEKKANFPVKYGDFLTNCEDFDNIPNINLKPENEGVNLGVLMPDSINKPIPLTQDTFKKSGINPLLPLQTTTNKLHPTLIVPPFIDSFDENKLICEIENDIKSAPTILNNNFNDNIKDIGVVQVQKEPKIKIISEKKISGPIKIKGALTKLSPGKTLRPIARPKIVNDKNPVIDLQVPAPKKPAKVIPQDNVCMEITQLPNSYKVNVEFEPNQPTETSFNTPIELSPKKEAMEQNVSNVNSKSKCSILKNKISPERMAAIEYKRQFNMKLRNIIEESLEGKVNLDKNCNAKLRLKKKPEPKKSDTEINSNTRNETSSLQQSTISFLEERLNKMENILLKRIDQNSQQITKLKATVNKPLGKKDTYVQTHESEKSYKMFLYHEISPYLSPATNSAIYEELFMSHFSIPANHKSKRRKHT